MPRRRITLFVGDVDVGEDGDEEVAERGGIGIGATIVGAEATVGGGG